LERTYNELIEEGLKANNRKADIKILQESLKTNLFFYLHTEQMFDIMYIMNKIYIVSVKAFIMNIHFRLFY